MCCFSGPVEHVADTSIFARLSDRGTQFLVYQMTYRASRPVAMILPLPVALPARENAVRFIDLKGYPGFFHDVRRAFPPLNLSIGCAANHDSEAASALTLDVHKVGDYIASFVPTLDDFRRLDRRFVLPRATWDAIPEYRDYGFAVFQLRASRGQDATPHPMAFEFPTRLSRTLFFPTVHIHDGQVHETEHFDHALYMQGTGPHGTASTGPASSFMSTARTGGVIVPDGTLRRVEMRGTSPNQDVFLSTLGDPRKAILPASITAVVAAYAFGRYRARRNRTAMPDRENGTS